MSFNDIDHIFTWTLSGIAFPCDLIIINCQIYLIILFIFNCLTLNTNLFILNLFYVKCLFSENQVFGKDKKMAVYGCALLVLGFEFPGRKVICYLWDLWFLRYLTLFKSKLKCGFPTKGIKLTWFVLFSGTRSGSAFRYFGLDHFRRYLTKICKIQVWVSLCRLCYDGEALYFFLTMGIFSFLDSISLYGWKDSHGSQRSLYCTTSRIDTFQLVQRWFVTHRKKIEEVHLVDEEFLHNKVNSNGFCMWIMVCYRIYSTRWM